MVLVIEKMVMDVQLDLIQLFDRPKVDCDGRSAL